MPTTFTINEIHDIINVMYGDMASNRKAMIGKHGGEWEAAENEGQRYMELVRGMNVLGELTVAFSDRFQMKVQASDTDAHLAGCDTSKQAPASAGVNSPEFFVCADPTCGKVGDIDDGHGNEYIPGPYCLECWNAICAENPILTESYDC